MASHAIAPEYDSPERRLGEYFKVIYASLDPEVQQMFLDVACFFNRAEKSLVVAIWDGSGWNGEDRWQTLLDNGFFRLHYGGHIYMRHFLQCLGRGIAEEVLPSRIWKKEQISSIQGESTQIRGILVGCWRMHYDDRECYSFFNSDVGLRHLMEKIMKTEPMPQSQLLAVEGYEFREEFEPLSRDLVWLSWKGFKGIKLPAWLSLKHLRVLELYDCENLEELWQDNVEPPLQLRELIIINRSLFKRFRCLPTSIGLLRHLKKFVLYGGGVEMRSLPEEFCRLESLEYLELSNIPALSTVGEPWGCNLKSLKYLSLSNTRVSRISISNDCCPRLETLKLSLNEYLTEVETLPENVREIIVTGCENLKNMRGTGGLLKLQRLEMTDCPDLKVLPCPAYLCFDNGTYIYSCPKLETRKRKAYVEIHVYDREDSVEDFPPCRIGIQGGGRALIRGDYPNDSGQMTKLKTFLIGSHNLTSLGELSCLTSLEIQDCKMLEFLPESFGSLFNLQSLKIEDTPLVDLGSPWGSNLRSLESLSLLNTGVKKISISDYCCPNLQILSLSSNIHLTAIDRLPKNVRGISVQGCEKMWTMMGICLLLNLEYLVIIDCPKLKLLPIPKYIFSDGRRISIRGCPKAVIDIFDDHRVTETVTSHDEWFI